MKHDAAILKPSIQRAPEHDEADDCQLSGAEDCWMEELYERESVSAVRRKVGGIRSMRTGKYHQEA
jgi:hypothetical protein